MIADSLTPYTETAKYFGAGIVVFVLFLGLYAVITRIKEIELIRGGNVAASISFGGAAVGFAIPLASVIFYSRNLTDMAIWSGIILVIQTLLHVVVRAVIPRIDSAIETGNVADGLFMATLSVTTGIIFAASITGFSSP